MAPSRARLFALHCSFFMPLMPFVQDLTRLLGPEAVLSASSDLAVYECDGFTIEKQTPAQIAPSSGVVGRTEQRAPVPPPTLMPPEKHSIAVLPFQNLSRDPEQEYFADGMVEDITTALSKVRWFFVIARNSSFTYKGRSVDPREAARELGVRYALEGSVRRSGFWI